MNAKTFARKAWEYIKWGFPILLFLVPVVWAGYYQVVDYLDIRPLPEAEPLTRWILGMLTLFLTSQGLQTLFYERPGQRIEDRLEKGFIELGEEIDQIVAPRLALCHSREDTFESLARFLWQASPPPSKKTVSITYFSEAYPDQDDLSKVFEREREKKLLQERSWIWRHLWTVQSKEKLAELREDLKTFEGVSGYLVRLLPSLPVPFMLEMYAVAGA